MVLKGLQTVAFPSFFAATDLSHSCMTNTHKTDLTKHQGRHNKQRTNAPLLSPLLRYPQQYRS
ncbi:hypothetical protein E2C01_083558 [Portunus trituberculatus]|uniref:Uncharacterized protein n=1 Tax=Portunus trituberculatus TaxID=210409 RepID=A0A5B7IXI2_PORTR|nr:hypothetical protein [Portunus trituberculatus]